MSSSAESSNLVGLPDAVLWSSRTWTDFAPARRPERQFAVLPVFGLADWGLGRPLDLEETLGTAILRGALSDQRAAQLPLILLPPLRWVAAPYPHGLFGVDAELAADLLREIAAGVHAAGVRRLVVFNTSPWNEAVIDASGRDLRVELGLQVFYANLHVLGLDLHPLRAGLRQAVQCAACACYQALPLDEPVRADITWTELRPANIRQPGSVPFDVPLETAIAEGTRLIKHAAERLAELLAEIAAAKPIKSATAAVRSGAATTRRLSQSRRKRAGGR